MIDIEKIKLGSLNHDPYPHVFVDTCINLSNVKKLVSNIPHQGFYLSQRTQGSDKTYTVANNIIFSLEKQDIAYEVLGNDAWMDILNDLISEPYKKAISQLFKIDLSKHFIEITLKKYYQNCFISPHTDKDHVRATHMFFLNEVWDKKWGGAFCIMSSSQMIERMVYPLWNKSILFLRTEKSWHSVTTCHSPEPRIAIQVAFWKTRDRVLLPGRIDVAY